MRRTLGLIVASPLLFAAGRTWAETCAVTVEGNDQIQFVQKELRVSSACAEITVTLKHIGSLPANVMGHNWVLSRTADYMTVAQKGQAAGPPNYVPAGDARVLAATGVVGGGQETSVTFDASILRPGADYTYFCSFPGHAALMFGKLVVE